MNNILTDYGRVKRSRKKWVVLLLLVLTLLSLGVIFVILFRLFQKPEKSAAEIDQETERLLPSPGMSPLAASNSAVVEKEKKGIVENVNVSLHPTSAPSPLVSPSPVLSTLPLPSPTTAQLLITQPTHPYQLSTTTVISEQIENGDFSNNLQDWEYIGDVNIKTESNHRFVQVGRLENEGSPAKLNALTQTIPAGVSTLSFRYNFSSYDYAGFDEPGFLVWVNDNLVFQKWASEVNKDAAHFSEAPQLDTTGWQEAVIDLSRFKNDQALTITFSAGNDLENLPHFLPHQTWVELDDVTTNQAVASNASTFSISPTPTNKATFFQVENDPKIRTGSTFQLSAQPTPIRLLFWSGQSEPLVKNSATITFDTSSPAPVTDLKFEKDANNPKYIYLSWTAPTDDKLISGYQVLSSTQPLKPTDNWTAANSQRITTTTSLTYSVPSGEYQFSSFSLDSLGTGTTYYIAIRAYDVASNFSSISNVIKITL